MAASIHNLCELSNDLTDGMEENEETCTELSGAPKMVNKGCRRRAADCDFMYRCEWIGCTHVSSSMNEFNHHVSLHRRGYTLCLGTDEEAGSREFVFYCQWQECNAQIEGQIDDFSRHVFYHTFHQYLKFLGQHIQTVENLENCQLDTASRNVIPELPEKLMCRWLDCGMTYDNPYIFYSHVTHHCEDYPKGSDPKIVITCKWESCSIVTKSVYKMKEHIRSHTQAKVVACPTCGSLFASNTRFIDHLKRQSQETDLNFECSHCNNRFATERILREHMRHHVNHYKCPLCDMTCHSPSAVRDHVRYRHSQERSFQCPKCDYKAKTATDLRRHIPSHAQKEEFICAKDGCNNVIKTKKDLVEYYCSEHEISKQYECHICSKSFIRGALLTSHLKEQHNYRWPSGHKRFRYKLHEDGIRRLQTIRYESIEVSQQVLGQNLTSDSASLQTGNTNSDTPGEDVLHLQDDGSDRVKNSTDNGQHAVVVEDGRLLIAESSDENCQEHTGQPDSGGHLIRETSFNNEDLENGIEVRNPSSGAAKICGPERDELDSHCQEQTSRSKQTSLLQTGCQTRSSSGRKRHRKKSAAGNEISNVNNIEDSMTEECRPKRRSRQRKAVNNQDIEADLQQEVGFGRQPRQI